MPGVVFIHGGGWVGGPLIQFRRQAAFLAAQGFVAATIEYRLSKEAKYPAQIYDCKAAVRWMRAIRMKYGIDGSKIAAVGGSADGHLAAMLGTTNGIRRLEGGGGNARYSSSVQRDLYGFTYNIPKDNSYLPATEQSTRWTMPNRAAKGGLC